MYVARKEKERVGKLVGLCDLGSVSPKRRDEEAGGGLQA